MLVVQYLQRQIFECHPTTPAKRSAGDRAHYSHKLIFPGKLGVEHPSTKIFKQCRGIHFLRPGFHAQIGKISYLVYISVGKGKDSIH